MEGCYWINTNSYAYVAVHLHGCGTSWPREEIVPPGWYGSYITKGAAIDAATTFERPIRECSMCIGDPIRRE